MKYIALRISFMFEKISKYFANRAADGAVEGVKTSVNEKMDKYGDIIMAGLALGIIVIGSRHITKQNQTNPYLYSGSQPIIINNYYQDPYSTRFSRTMSASIWRSYEQREIKYLQQQGKMDQRYQNRR